VKHEPHASQSTPITQHVYWQFAKNANSAVTEHW